MAKGRKEQAKKAAAAKLASELASRPARQALPTIGKNSVNGTNAHNLALFKIWATPYVVEELIEWQRVLADELPDPRPNEHSCDILSKLVKDLPAAVTFLPADPEQDWEECELWLATTGAPKYTPPPGMPVREIDPEKTAEGATPLLACLHLIESRIKKKAWAFAGKARSVGGLPIQHYGTVEEFYRRNGLEFN